jgi:predicted dehydrogenase
MDCEYFNPGIKTMNNKIRWGILSTAKIGMQKVIPAMQQGKHCEIVAIASRDIENARNAAAQLGIGRFYGSYEELLADGDIDAIYNPLPNHLHVPWSIKCLLAGKHVLCEKPLGINAQEIRELITARDKTGLKVGEAFMIRSHPQWRKTLKLIKSGDIGDVKAIQGGFYYRNLDPGNIRNKADFSGGAMMDIGCYPLLAARMVFDREPERVIALMDFDPVFKTDRLTSVVLQFADSHATFTVSTQNTPHQFIEILGDKKRISIEIPFNAPPDKPTRIQVYAPNLPGQEATEYRFEICNQYTLQGDDFARAILDNTDVSMPLEDSLKNAAVIDAIFKSAKSGGWEKPEK